MHRQKEGGGGGGVGGTTPQSQSFMHPLNLIVRHKECTPKSNSLFNDN
jgi:hypothetical protein